ncbi:hypothetical protein RZQ58_27090, partial [Raoultella planticola]|nr:hypothetical protein [Raoultella planticola]
LKMPAFEWVHVQLHQQKGMISLSPPTICNSAVNRTPFHKAAMRRIYSDLPEQSIARRVLVDFIR